MNVNFRGIGFSVTEEDRAFLERKLKKLSFAEDYLQDLDITAKKDSRGFLIDAVLHFSWKKEKAVSAECYELLEGIETIADKIQSAAKKEKERTMGL